MVNIPLIVTLPGKQNAGKEMPQLINGGVDFFASVCDWAGISLPGNLHGVSFKSLAESADPQQAHQPYVVTETTFDKGYCPWLGFCVLHVISMYYMIRGSIVSNFMIWSMTAEKCGI